jgi:hypothetical protein
MRKIERLTSQLYNELNKFDGTQIMRLSFSFRLIVVTNLNFATTDFLIITYYYNIPYLAIIRTIANPVVRLYQRQTYISYLQMESVDFIDVF